MKLAKVFAAMLFVAGFSCALYGLPLGAPELDPGSVTSAAMLVGGALLIIRNRNK